MGLASLVGRHLGPHQALWPAHAGGTLGEGSHQLLDFQQIWCPLCTSPWAEEMWLFPEEHGIGNRRRRKWALGAHAKVTMQTKHLVTLGRRRRAIREPCAGGEPLWEGIRWKEQPGKNPGLKGCAEEVVAHRSQERGVNSGAG